jgi:hypothetical protein
MTADQAAKLIELMEEISLKIGTTNVQLDVLASLIRNTVAVRVVEDRSDMRRGRGN